MRPTVEMSGATTKRRREVSEGLLSPGRGGRPAAARRGAKGLCATAFALCVLPGFQDPATWDLAPGAELPCAAGTWVGPESGCDCPAPGGDVYTSECAAADCEERDVLVLRASGEAIRASVRTSASLYRMSAIGGGAEQGTWEHLDDGELVLAFGGGATYTPTECSPEGGGELQMHMQPLFVEPPPGLLVAITWAWWTGEWTAVPLDA